MLTEVLTTQVAIRKAISWLATQNKEGMGKQTVRKFPWVLENVAGCALRKRPFLGAKKATGIVWSGCHQALNGVSCSNDYYYLIGFSSDSITATGDLFYPLSPALCCRPGVLLDDGSLWSIEQCNCVQRTSVSCNPNQDEFLTGFLGQEQNLNSFLPVAPVSCCGMCLGDKSIDLTDCSTYNYCSSNGNCVQGNCICDQGWTGPNCDEFFNDGSQSSGISLGLLPVLIIASITACICLLTCIKRIVLSSRRWYVTRHGDSDERSATLIRVPVEGSVGSADTSVLEGYGGVDGEGDGERVPIIVKLVSLVFPRNVLMRIARNDRVMLPNQIRNQSSLSDRLLPETGLEASEERVQNLQVDFMQQNADQQTTQVEDGEDEELDVLLEEQQLLDGEQRVRAQIDQRLEEEGAKGPLINDGMLNCSLCFERPVQVALVPCGHSNLCRKCSRKLNQCPFCRKQIVRRQRLFLTD
eukprot:TRINITY_DN5442_c0_g1_i7.p1 TRINITY_DN5442_c0_g1~~TRINITY_DN5442_c0_g1_i7.p1  ORF type:complete len:469 (-),score=67.79 TRINITY_DN5442_c0_g1_i7:549-1955(-)